MTTKERIINEALSLFSVNGFKGTSVKNIADAVGIRDSSVYKHFKNKQEILDGIVDMMQERVESMSNSFGLPQDSDIEKYADIYTSFDEDMLVDFCKNVFLFYFKDSFVSRFWRMGNMEQFRNPKVYGVFHAFFLEKSISYQTSLFKLMSSKKILIDVDPQVIAMNFYTPIFFLISKYANEPQKEDEALAILDKQVREFYRIYRRKE